MNFLKSKAFWTSVFLSIWSLCSRRTEETLLAGLKKTAIIQQIKFGIFGFYPAKDLIEEIVYKNIHSISIDINSDVMWSRFLILCINFGLSTYFCCKFYSVYQLTIKPAFSTPPCFKNYRKEVVNYNL